MFKCADECVCVSVRNSVSPELSAVWAAGLTWTDRLGGGVVVFVKVYPQGLQSQLQLTSNLPPLPLALTHTHTGIHTRRYTQAKKKGRTVLMSTWTDVKNA